MIVSRGRDGSDFRKGKETGTYHRDNVYSTIFPFLLFEILI